MLRPSNHHIELIRAIADQLKPWRCSEGDVLAKIRSIIQETAEGLSEGPATGFRKQNKQYAMRLLDNLVALQDLLARAPAGFLWNLANWSEPKKLGTSLVKRQTQWKKLRETVNELVPQCKAAIRNPTGASPLTRWEKTHVAVNALSLMKHLSAKRPTAGTDNTPFCVIASLLFEAVTGEREASLRRACQRILPLLDALPPADDPSLAVYHLFFDDKA
jgi:hypothetical protein